MSGKSISDYIRVLVVEDDSYLREVICDAIRLLGIRHIHEASEGTEALSMTVRIRPDVVFCDVQMDPMGGLEYLTKLRQVLDSEVAGTPVVFLTATTDVTTVEQAKKLNASGFIAKPPRGEALKAAINRVLGKVVA
ncbi:MAG TPA: response regulator [Rhodospirillaceae bacterium]|nr:hypothetical protein [Alphaproteobacteria bacterium]OUT42491.1 MAG: hypothetical protein CBB62_09585 [Micavibrio sp. TMED2]HCI45866.1 response regulator [Rhodospirillaceae bacterium]MAS45850.1 hypothetical protein [Alphaproteobacteria bacterium]MAX95968.1 hypothetical protein [Alphaproteobacteria bacterium]|tara:strand:+ start:6040 stop:6447 length:408 start_codon:yes stop_codon:yes gene_type:complete